LDQTRSPNIINANCTISCIHYWVLEHGGGYNSRVVSNSDLNWRKAMIELVI